MTIPAGDEMIYSESTVRALTIAASTAFLFGTSIILLQFDSISRQILSPNRLRSKRRATVLYKLSKAIQNSSNALICAAGGGRAQYHPEEDRAMTTLLITPSEMDHIVQDIVTEKDASKAPFIVSIQLDEDDPRAHREYYLYLAFPPPTKSTNKYRRVQVPLGKFCEKLADAFEEKLTSTALCFVADASSGLSGEVLGEVLTKCGAGLALVNEPAWMVTIANLIQNNIIAKSKMERILFALCRLDASRVRASVGDSRTVVFMLPGQSCTPPLLPLLQKVFPCERHVFAYDTCAESLCHALHLGLEEKQKNGLFSGLSTSGGEFHTDLLSANHSLMASLPMAPLRSLRDLPPLLAKFTEDQANIIECWMSSVNAFLMMKQNEDKNEYLPFVCRMGFLLGRTGLGDGYTDLSDIALQNVLQYITGSRSRPLKDEVVEAARVALKDARTVCEQFPRADKQLTEEERALIEECVFCHKEILIGNKTLIDTVQPTKEWSLKSTSRLTGCACCGPEDEYTEEDDMIGKVGQSTYEKDDVNGGSSSASASAGFKMNGVDLSVPGAGFATGLTQRKTTTTTTAAAAPAPAARPAFVDGKTQFAFDPTKFS